MKTLDFDFVVCGAGISGMIAAVSAARKGLKVALINDRSVPGGNASSEIGVVIQGSSHHGLNYSVYAKETGLIDELRSKLDYAVSYCGYDVAAACDAVFLDFLYAEPNLTLYLNTDVAMNEGEIASVGAYQMRQDEKLEFVAPLYADCTGDAVIAYKAGADIAMGAEAQNEFGEKSADHKPQTWTMGNTLYFEIEDVGHPVTFIRPAFAHDVSQMDFMKDMNNPAKMRMLYVGGRFWTLEYGGQVDTIRDNEHINLELRKLVYGLWDYIKNSGEYPEAANFKIKRVYSMAGSRESRRIMGDYILTETDLDRGTHFDDSVLTGGWPMDLHAPKGIYDELPASAFIPVTSVYDIPYRCLYSRNIENLFMAGRNISTTHIALSSTRVMGTCGAMGQAVGTAAWLCKEYGLRPRDIYLEKIDRLQDVLLHDDQFIIGKRDSGCKNLEKHFVVSADSTSNYENATNTEIVRPLFHCLGVALPLKNERLDSISLKIQYFADHDETLGVRVMIGTKKESYVPEKAVADFTVIIEAGFDGWKEIHVNQLAGTDGKLYIVLQENESLAVYGTREKMPGVVTSKFYTEKRDGYDHNTCPLHEETGYVGQDNLCKQFNLCFRDVFPQQDIFETENLLNGFTRPYGHMNMWLSECCKNASVVIKADSPQSVHRLEIFFDNELEDDRRNIIPETMIKAYNVVLLTADGEARIEIRDNFQRKNVVEINRVVSEIKLELIENYGAQRYAIYGVKLY